MIKETDEGGNGWTYDSHASWVEVSVTRTQEGLLSAEVTGISGNTTFKNMYASTPGSTDLVLARTKDDYR